MDVSSWELSLARIEIIKIERLSYLNRKTCYLFRTIGHPVLANQVLPDVSRHDEIKYDDERKIHPDKMKIHMDE